MQGKFPTTFKYGSARPPPLPHILPVFILLKTLLPAQDSAIKWVLLFIILHVVEPAFVVKSTNTTGYTSTPGGKLVWTIQTKK